MKRCSTCNRTYTDPNLSFCIDDGTPLTPVAADDDTTVVKPRDNPDDSWNAVAYKPPGSYVPPGTEIKRRRMWPWVVGIVGAFILGIATIAIVAAIVAPRLIREAQRNGSNVNKRVESPNTNTAEPSNANTATTEHVDVNTPPPTDHDQVLAQLTEIENDWTVANLNADKKKLDRILADDFVGQGNQGELESKADYLRDIQRDTSVDKWEFGDLKLTLIGDRSILTGTITYYIDDEKRVFDFTDKFVWRDDRWQATASAVKPKESSDLTF